MEYNFKIRNDRIEAIDFLAGVTGNINTYTCKFDIVCDIPGLIWFCIFKQGSEVYDTVLKNNTCSIPCEVLIKPEPLYIGCFGKLANDEIKQISTNMVYFDLKQGAYEVAEAPAEPPEDAYTILLKSLKAPYIGENGNWYEWDSESCCYVDSGVPSTIFMHTHENKTILDGITQEKICEWDTVNEIKEDIGDIETALDNIIAIQNELIGGDS